MGLNCQESEAEISQKPEMHRVQLHSLEMRFSLNLPMFSLANRRSTQIPKLNAFHFMQQTS